MLTYRFMRVAFLVCLFLGVSLPLLGSKAVFKRLSSSGDALAHSSLAGVAIGLACGLNPLWVGVICCVLSFFLIEFLRKRFSKYAEIGVAVVLSASIGLAGILSSFSSASNFDSYLFGSILLLSDEELYLTLGLAVLSVAFEVIFFHQSFATISSEDEAKVAGIRTGWITFAQDLLFSITIAIGSKVVGSLVVSSLVVLPTAIALQFKKGYRFTILTSVLVSLVSMGGGLTLAYYLDLKPGATIVSLAVALLLLAMLGKGIWALIQRIQAKRKAKAKDLGQSKS